jgi:thioredoxin-like negative regulator of GroEL
VPAKVVSATKVIPAKKKPAPFTYDYARRETDRTGKPLLVFVGAEWCGACVKMKKNVIPDLKKSKLIGKVAFATVDFDENKKLSKTLTAGGPIPQTILFCKDKKGWHTHKLVGGQSLKNVESLIKESLAHAPKAKEEKVAGQDTKTR